MVKKKDLMVSTEGLLASAKAFRAQGPKAGLLFRNAISITITWIYSKLIWFLDCGNLD